MAVEVLSLRPLHLAARQHQSGAARKQTGGVAKKTRVATAVARIAAVAGTLTRAAGEATVVKISAEVEVHPAERASAITAVPLGTAAGVDVSRAVELLALRVDAMNHPDRIAAEGHLHHGATQSLNTATVAVTGVTTAGAEPAMRGCN